MMSERLTAFVRRGRGEALVLSGARGVSALCALGIAMASARQLGPGSRGEIVLVVTVAMLASEVVALGSDTSGRVSILRGGGVMVGDLLGLTIVLSLVQGGVVATALFAINKVSGLLESNLVLPGVLLGVAMFQGRMLTGGGFAVRRPMAVALHDVLVGLAPLVAVFWVAVTHRLSTESVVGLIALGYGVGDVYLWGVVLRHSDRFHIRPRRWKRILTQGIPVLASGLAQMIVFRFDRLVVGLAVGASDLGVYSVAATAAEAPRVLLIATTQILTNRIATGELIRSSRATAMRNLVFGYWLLLGLTAVVVPRLLVSVVGDGFSGAEGQVPILVIGEALMGAHLVMMSLLIGTARFRALPGPSIAGALVFLTGCVLFVPSGGETAAALVRVASFGLMAVVSSVLVFRRTRHPEV